MKKTISLILTLLSLQFIMTGITSAAVTGDPSADGWSFLGNSLQKGFYALGSANYCYDMYSTAITVAAGSSLHIADGDYSWLSGDTILGTGGRFTNITPVQTGWSSFTGNTINSQLAQEYGPKLQIKLGTAAAAWSVSTKAPGSGNGSTSTSSGGVGTVHFRTSGWFHATTPSLDQVTDTTWSGNSGMLMLLDKDDHIRRVTNTDYYYPDTRVARVIWVFDAALNKPIGWELLLNTSLLDRVAPIGFTGATPGLGNAAVWSVQDRDSAFTDAVATVVPEPAMFLLLLSGLAGIKK